MLRFQTVKRSVKIFKYHDPRKNNEYFILKSVIYKSCVKLQNLSKRVLSRPHTCARVTADRDSYNIIKHPTRLWPGEALDMGVRYFVQVNLRHSVKLVAIHIHKCVSPVTTIGLSTN